MELSRLTREQFIAALDGIFEHSPWVAERAWDARPFGRVVELHAALVAAMMDADTASQLALIRAHPELAGRAAIRGELTAYSSSEQQGSGLLNCSPQEYAQLQSLNADYIARFGFPFILAVKGLPRIAIIANFQSRVANSYEREFAECLQQIARIAMLRLVERVVDSVPSI